MVSPELLELLACPVCENRPPLVVDEGGLRCTQCQRWYAVVNGIPHLLPEEGVIR